MSDKKTNKLDEVNATLDRFAKLIEENAEQSRRDKAEYDRQRAEDKAKAEAEAKQRQQEWDRQRAEDKAEAKQRQQEWDRQFAKSQAEWEKRMENLNDQVGGQGNSIGEITEAMTVSDNILDLLNKFTGIAVDYFSFNMTKKYPAINANGKKIRKQHEVDGFASGDKVVVVIEAKTSLTKEYIERFLEKKLANFKLAYPEYRDKDIYGAVTFIRTNNDAYDLAEQHGLFIIKASPPDVELVNNQGFKPTKIT